MAESENFSIVPRQSSAIGIELHELDHRQLIFWAEQLRLKPREVFQRLMEGLRQEGNETRIINGKFVKLNWDPGILPPSEFQISQQLHLEQLSFAPIEGIAEDGPKEHGVSQTDDLPQGYDPKVRILHISTTSMPRLKSLECGRIGLKTLSIKRAVSLERLFCWGNNLEAIDLIPFPNLMILNCQSNILAALDLTEVPKLVELNCQSNLISDLDLGWVSKLRKLNCSDNDMREIILPELNDLVELECENSSWDKELGLGRHLEKIDLRGAPNLERLNCSANMLEHLALEGVPKLKYLDCSWNPLTELDLTEVPLLETLKCCNIPRSQWSTGDPPLMSSLDIRSLRFLNELDCDNRTRIIQRPDQCFKAVKN